MFHLSLCATLAPAEESPLLKGREVALLGKEALFRCSVQSPDDAAEVHIWWQTKGRNISNSDRYEVQKEPPTRNF